VPRQCPIVPNSPVGTFSHFPPFFVSFWLRPRLGRFLRAINMRWFDPLIYFLYRYANVPSLLFLRRR